MGKVDPVSSLIAHETLRGSAIREVRYSYTPIRLESSGGPS